MLIRDGQSVLRDTAINGKETELDKARRWAWEQHQSTRVIVDLKDSAVNMERQMGRPLLTRDVLERLQRINPKFDILPAPNPKNSFVVFQLPSGELARICPCERYYMPEFSIMSAEQTYEPHPFEKNLKPFDHPGEPIRTKELASIANEVNPTNDAPDGGEKEALDRIEALAAERMPGKEDNPGWVGVTREWHELMRGWRTVLARIVMAGFASVGDCEREFGISNREDWNVLMGKVL